MADLTITQVATGRVRIPSLLDPIVFIGSSINRLVKACGSGLFVVSAAYAHALELAYAKPPRSSPAAEPGLEGRDPAW